RLARADVHRSAFALDAQRSPEHDRDFLEVWTLARLEPAGRRDHARDAHRPVPGVDATGILLDPFRLVTGGGDDGGGVDKTRHRRILVDSRARTLRAGQTPLTES